MSELKKKIMSVDSVKIKRFAIAGVVVTAVVLFIFAMSLSDAKKFGERDICESATTITTTGSSAFQSKSINKNYTAYMIVTGNEYNFGKTKNTIYVVQETGIGVRAYKVANSNVNKGNILSYFNTVKEVDKLPTSLVAGGLLAATIVVPLLLGILTIALWIWWYLLNKQDEQKRLAIQKAQIANSTTNTRMSQPRTTTPQVSSNNTPKQANEKLVDTGLVKPVRKQNIEFQPILPLGHPDYMTRTFTKVMRIKESVGDKAGFGEAEILKSIVDIEKAKQYLSAVDYKRVKRVYDYFDSHWKLQLSYQGYIDKCFDIVSHFDVIVPYWKFAGNLFPLKVKFVMQDKDKAAYRLKAIKLLDSHTTEFSPEFVNGWIDLNNEFFQVFYVAGFDGDSVLNTYHRDSIEAKDSDEVIIARKKPSEDNDDE